MQSDRIEQHSDRMGRYDYTKSTATTIAVIAGRIIIDVRPIEQRHAQESADKEKPKMQRRGDECLRWGTMDRR